MVTAGITQGDSDGKFRPTKDVDRQEFALFVARAINLEYWVSKVEEPIKEEPIKEEPIKEAPIKEEPIKEAFVKVASNDVLNVRSGPGTSHSIVGALKLNDQVSVYSYEGDWARINSGTVTGYVNSNYLTSSKVSEAKEE